MRTQKEEKLLSLLVAILAQAFFALVRRHFVAFVFFTVGHNIEILKLFLHSLHKGLGGLERRNIVRRNHDGGVLGDIGCVLAQEWSGVGYDDRVRLMGDFGARLYLIEKK